MAIFFHNIICFLLYHLCKSDIKIEHFKDMGCEANLVIVDEIFLELLFLIVHFRP